MKMLKKVGRNLMAREILLTLNKKKSSFEISKIDRKKLYGFKKRIFLDEKNKECSKANLEEETGIVFVNSDISSCYLDHKGNYIEKSNLEAINDNGKNVKKEDSTIGKEVNVNSITTEDALNLKVNSVYHLEPKEFDEDLKSKLDKGDLFSFPFNYYADFKLEDGIILKSEKEYFALIGRKTSCHWVGENSDDLPEDVEEFEDNDLDFEMI
jgi:hypothetical protein|tara:strand:+ start:358 stop:990 length:633 start_codon:yes stop_codon:yes gene_type:complete